MELHIQLVNLGICELTETSEDKNICQYFRKVISFSF